MIVLITSIIVFGALGLFVIDLHISIDGFIMALLNFFGSGFDVDIAPSTLNSTYPEYRPSFDYLEELLVELNSLLWNYCGGQTIYNEIGMVHNNVTQIDQALESVISKIIEHFPERTHIEMETKNKILASLDLCSKVDWTGQTESGWKE